MQLYDFLKAHKEYSYNKNIPHGSYLCETCDNYLLFAKELNKKLEEPLLTNPHDLVEKFACDLNIKKCVLNQYESCSSNNFGFGLKKDHANSESPKSEEETNGGKVKYFPWTKFENRLTKATFTVAFEDAVAKMKEKLIVLKNPFSSNQSKMKHTIIKKMV